jgi:predicted transcriptional regulator
MGDMQFDWGCGPSWHNKAMEISLAPELEARLARIDSEAGKAANQVVQELVANYVDHDEWFKRKCRKGWTLSTAASLCRMSMWAGKSSASSDPDDSSLVS